MRFSLRLIFAEDGALMSKRMDVVSLCLMYNELVGVEGGCGFQEGDALASLISLINSPNGLHSQR